MDMSIDSTKSTKKMAAGKATGRSNTRGKTLLVEMTPQLASEDVAANALFEFAYNERDDFWPMLRTIFDSVNQGIIVANRYGRVTIFNQKAQQIMGYTTEDVVGRCLLWDFCDSCESPPVFQKSLMEGQCFPPTEIEMYTKDSSVALGVRVTPLYNKDNELQGAVATIRDLGAWRARKREQRSLVRMASIGRIVSAIAHEINNPLQTVRTSLELGFDPRKSSERRQEYLRTADQEISRIAKIIGQMRKFYRPSAAEEIESDVNEVINDALYILEENLQKAGVEIQTNLAADLPLVQMVGYQLEQVFLNLLLNALETMPKGGKLRVESYRSDLNTITVSFTDNAELKNDISIEELFDPFAGNRTDGLGLGLSVSQEIIAEVGGRIEAKLTDPSGGYILTVYLPCQEEGTR